MKERLTERQSETLAFIRAYVRDHQVPPTLQEIGQALEVGSINAVYKLVDALERKGYLARRRGVARGVQLIDSGERAAMDQGVRLPLLGRFSGRNPERLRERPAGFVFVDALLLRGVADPSTCLVGRVGDGEMDGEGIRKGDLAVIQELPAEELHEGELVAVLQGGTLIVRRLSRSDGRIQLTPPSPLAGSEFTTSPHLLGRLLGLMRRY